MAQIKAATDALQKKLAAVQADMGKLGGSEAVKAMTEKVAEIDKAIAALRSQAAAAQAARTKLAAQIAALTTRVDKAALSGNRSAALVAAIGQVRARALSGQPYAAELDAARSLAKDTPTVAPLLAQLAVTAKTGVPTRAALAAEFEPLASRIVRAARAPESGDWIDRAWAKVRSSITVRRTGGNVKGDTPEALVARAEAALQKGALAPAVKLVAALPAGARKPAEAWLTQAKARLAVETASAALGRAAVKLAAGQTAATPDKQ